MGNESKTTNSAGKPAATTAAGTASTSPTVKSRIAQARARARSVGEYINNWIGLGPRDLDETVKDGELPQHEIEDILDMPLTVFGYSLRTGDKNEFAVILCSEENVDSLFVIVTGGMVIMKKLAVLAEGKHFPINGRFIQSKGKKFEYFDFV